MDILVCANFNNSLQVAFHEGAMQTNIIHDHYILQYHVVLSLYGIACYPPPPLKYTFSLMDSNLAAALKGCVGIGVIFCSLHSFVFREKECNEKL